MKDEKIEHFMVVEKRQLASEVLNKISSQNTNQYECKDRQRIIHNLTYEESFLLEIMLRDYLNEYIC